MIAWLIHREVLLEFTVFFSVMVWKGFRWHDRDIRVLPGEVGFIEDLQRRYISPGFYMLPRRRQLPSTEVTYSPVARSLYS